MAGGKIAKGDNLKPVCPRLSTDEPENQSEDLVRVWLRSYEVEKERQFIKHIDRLIPNNRVKLVEIRCRIGLHTQLWSERNKQVTGSDFCEQFRDHFVRTYRFPFVWNDVLNSTMQGQYDICFCMAIGTILHDEELRFQTFRTLAQLVGSGSYLVLVTGSNQRLIALWRDRVVLHSLNARDLQKLRDFGFKVEKVFYWSSTPKFLWRSPVRRTIARLAETICTRLGIGARKVAICRKERS